MSWVAVAVVAVTACRQNVMAASLPSKQIERVRFPLPVRSNNPLHRADDAVHPHEVYEDSVNW